MKAEGRRLKAEGKKRDRRRPLLTFAFCLLPSAFSRRLLLTFAFCLLPSAFCLELFASNNLSVDRRNLRAGETLIITVSLEDEFAGTDDVPLPVHNLTLLGAPSISSEFSWINGVVVRRKVFRFRARPVRAGPARIGPVTLAASDGQRDTLTAQEVQVLPDRAATSNDPAVILRELSASNRDPFFVVAEADKTAAFVGEQVVVTWWLYNAMAVDQWHIGSIPKLSDFWVEELDVRGARPVTTFVDGYAMQKVPVRRAALFPLRSGTLDVGPMEVEAAVLRRRSDSPFRMFEGNIIEISFASAHVSVLSRPIPPGPPVAAVGDFGMRCQPPVQKNGGPVVVQATISGAGNIRSAQAPRFVSAPAGDVQLVQSPVTVQRAGMAPAPVMTRRWEFALFPRSSGTMKIPAMEMAVFSPSTAARSVLRCEAATLNVTAAPAPAAPKQDAEASAPESRRRNWPLVAAVAGLAAIALLFLVPHIRERRRVNRQLRELTASGEPAQIRESLHARLEERGVNIGELMKESSDRGDAYRSVRSLLDALERDRIEVSDVQREIRRRMRDLLAV